MLTYICCKYDGCAVQHQIYGIDGLVEGSIIDGGEYLPVFSHFAVFCIGLSNVEMEGRKKYNSLLQHLYYCKLICVQVERCVLPRCDAPGLQQAVEGYSSPRLFIKHFTAGNRGA